MDLTLFHYGPKAGDSRNWKMKDRLNGCTGLAKCRFLEWSGWYNQDLLQRLLGHYRLFQHFKKEDAKIKRNMPLVMAYIFHYRVTHGVKYFASRIMSITYWIGTRGESYPAVEIEGLNKMLLNEGSGILSEFLANADEDFEQALRNVVQKLTDPAFFNKVSDNSSTVPSPTAWINIHNAYKTFNNNARQYNEFNEFNEHHEHNEFNQLNQFNQHNEFNQLNIQNINNDITFESTTNNTEYHHHNVTKSGARGKEAGVFSKLQLLILFDLLYEAADIEKIDLAKPNKFDDVASLFHGLTGKTKESWLQELKDHQKNGLYAFHTEGEKNQLIGTLVNLGETFRKAGFRSIAKLADRKIKELERTKKDGPAN